MIHEITDENFQAEVVQSELPCVIQFTAGWCTMCDEMAPAFESLADTFEGQVKFCRVNTDAQKQLRIRFAVAALPYLVFVADGMKTPLFDQIVSAQRLEERIRFMLEGGTAPNTRPV
ncbi:thioredoxin family protein [Adlercreutzia murintestinalis]|jgi:Thioredoxin domain-containing protein|uniref:thioredoxin family protein n=1 Tax=Adlercreutzia murintestinalis TaxID=2941325 RepID=UPI00203AF119|nr:thioredoxin domain-containing protein [Adlercreutzia murintestinalis]